MIRLWADIRLDLRNYSPVSYLLSRSGHVILSCRLANYFWRHGFGFLGNIIHKLSKIIYPVDISYRATIGGGLSIPHPIGIVIGPGVIVGMRCLIMQGVTLGNGNGGQGGGYPEVGDEVMVNTNCVVAGPVKIGSRSIIGACSFVNRDVPVSSLVAGVPARVIKSINRERYRYA